MSRRGPAPSRLRHHAYTPDATVPPDQDGRQYCTCGAPKDHVRHDLPTPDPETRALTARITGDRED
jgi:hypothetical protein